MPGSLVIAGTPGRELGSSYGVGFTPGIINGANGVPWVFADGRWGASRDEAPTAYPRDIRRMLEQDGKALQVAEAITLPLRAAETKVDGGEGDQAQWTRDWMGRLDPPWEVVMGQLAGGSLYIRALFEIVWGIGPDGRICPVRVAFRPTDNTDVVLDNNGQPTSLLQRLGGGKNVEIPAERSLIYLHNQHRAPGVGVSDIGPTWAAHWRKKALVSLWAIFLNRAAMPWTIAKSDNATDTAQIGKLARQVATIKSGGVVGLGQGESATTLDAGGQAGAVFLAALEWLDRQMTQSTMTQFLDLGQAKVGSFALSKDHSDFFTLGREAVLKDIAADWQRQVVARAIRANWTTGMPTFSFETLTEGNQDQIATLLAAIATAPALNPGITAEFVRQLVLADAKVLGLDVEAIRGAMDTAGTPVAQMNSALDAGVHVLRAALPAPIAA